MHSSKKKSCFNYFGWVIFLLLSLGLTICVKSEKKEKQIRCNFRINVHCIYNRCLQGEQIKHGKDMENNYFPWNYRKFRFHI